MTGRGDYFGVFIKRGTEVVQYEPSDIYDQSITGFSGDYQYYGYLNTLGGWIIQRQQLSTGQFRYCAGTSLYSTNWTNKGSLVYGTFDSIFA
jgi:hypothetical protein